MNEILLGTKNKDKRAELVSLLKGAKIRVLSLADFPSCPEVHEDGRTFDANAKKKARFYSLYAGKLTLADDSGLMVYALNGKPGVYSARFAGPGCSYTDNNLKLIDLLKNKTQSARRAKFVSSMALYDKGKFIACVKGECHGKIALESKGKNGFGYDPVFIPDGYSKTFAELASSTKNKISHRFKALQKAKTIILRYCSK